jgi:hypothetical protein
VVGQLGEDFVPVLVEKDDEPKLIDRYGLMQFPTIVWTDAAGDALALTIQPESPEEAIGDLESARKWLRHPAGEPEEESR